MLIPRRRDAFTAKEGRRRDRGPGLSVVLSAHVRLSDVEEHTEPYTVTRKSDGMKFTLDPGFKCTVEVVDDRQGGDDNGTKFFETFEYKQDPDSGEWFNKENSKLGQLTSVIKAGYFDDDSIPELAAADLESFEMLCRVKPKRTRTRAQ